VANKLIGFQLLFVVSAHARPKLEVQDRKLLQILCIFQWLE